jgi:hypothetical protein
LPPSTYGFSTVFTSIACPYACADHRGGPGATALRQLNAEVLSAAIDAGSLPPYASTGCIRRIGNRASYKRWNTVITESATDALTIMVPECGAASKPQYDMCNARSCAGPTGQPAWYDAGKSAEVTAITVPENAGAAAALGRRPRGAVLIGVEANVVVVGAAMVFDGAAVVVVDEEVLVDVGADVVAGGDFELEALHPAPSTTVATSAIRQSATQR